MGRFDEICSERPLGSPTVRSAAAALCRCRKEFTPLERSHSSKVRVPLGLDEDDHSKRLRQQGTNLLRGGPGQAGHPHHLLTRRRRNRRQEANPKRRCGRGLARIGGVGR